MLYELTITLKPNLYQLDPRDQFDLSSIILCEILNPFQSSMIAELTMEHNIHYHGIVQLEDIIDKNILLNRFRRHYKVFGRKSCSQIRYEKSYCDYLVKDKEKTQQILKKCPIVRDQLGLIKCPLFGDEDHDEQ